MRTLLLIALAGHLVAAEPAPPSPAWLADITRVAYTDLPNAVRTETWPTQVIDDFAAAGVQMMFSRAQSGSGWDGLGWRSKYGEPASTMDGFDGTRDVVEQCHRLGLRYVAYYWAQREPASLATEHPEYLQRNAASKPLDTFCFNNPDYRALVRQRIVELVADWDVDGIFFDMYHPGVGRCYCDHCRAAFKARSGQDAPATEDLSDPLWQDWTKFKQDSITATLLEFNRAIKAADPDAILLTNSWNAWVYRKGDFVPNGVDEVDSVDGLLEEIGWYDRADPNFFAFPARHNYMCAHLSGLCRDKRAFMWGSPSNAGWPTLGPVEPHIRVMTMLTNGCVPTHSVPGRDVLADYLPATAALDETVKGAEPYPWCGLVVSQKTELWYGQEQFKESYLNGVYGAFQTLLERHLPVEIVTDHQLASGQLPPYRVLFLPNTAILSDAEMATLRKFVQDGGSLVATHETSLFDEHGRQRDDFGLADLFGAHFLARHDTTGSQHSQTPPMANLWFPPTHPWYDDPELSQTLTRRSVLDPPGKKVSGVPVFCRMLEIEPHQVGTVHVRIGGADTKERQLWSCVGVVEHEYGKGKVVYLPFDISGSYFRWGFECLARLMELSLREAATEPPPVTVDAPSIVQASTFTQGDRLVVHLLNDISSTGRSQNVANESRYERREVIPIHDIRLTFPPGYGRVRLYPGGEELPVEVVADGVQVSLPPLGVHWAVVAAPSP